MSIGDNLIETAGISFNEDTPAFYALFLRTHIKTIEENQNGKRKNAKKSEPSIN
ncbi:hypothetical protein [Desulfitobacterium hafniense]|uniref:Uncharacterized protein n=2 Tax=root TaxID=1 RepID=G9XU57_DESHA|nr:hypothetical protein [Desulfitobacterium hafniense]EHL04840.1 hypothetical protein HMPREF0322_04515 [Desulfitobacterium hafniense DP7]MEA5022111.1 hypothetical protein [Desulfitobacterium hafniense]